MEENIQSVLAVNLKYLLKEKDWKQSDLEKASIQYGHVNHRTISAYVNKSGSANPTLAKVEILAKSFNMNVCELLNPDMKKKQISDPKVGSVKEAFKESVMLLIESDVIDLEHTEVILKYADDIQSMMSILLERNGEESRSTMLRVLSYLNTRKC
ncbi:helix-turn-helix domain-containing protein [bacterium]|nr:helix-turn-helix domain-containing protein [bacterium]